MTTPIERYWVAGADGQTYGPVDLATLQQWVQQGTVTAQSSLCLESDVHRQWFPATHIPQLGLAAQAHAHAGYQTLPASGQVYGGLPDRLPFTAAEAGARMDHQLSSFSPGLVVLFHFLSCGLFSTIWFGIQHGNLPKIARDDPGAGKAIGFLLIPFFNFYWVFVFWMRLCDRVNLQLALRGLKPNAPRGLAMAMCIVMLIPYVGLLSYLVLSPITAALLQTAINRLDNQQHL